MVKLGTHVVINTVSIPTQLRQYVNIVSSGLDQQQTYSAVCEAKLDELWEPLSDDLLHARETV